MRFRAPDHGSPFDRHFAADAPAARVEDWFAIPDTLSYSDEDDRPHLLDTLGLLPIGQRWATHQLLAIRVTDDDDRRIHTVHLTDVWDAVADGAELHSYPVFDSYASMLSAIAEAYDPSSRAVVAAIDPAAARVTIRP